MALVRFQPFREMDDLQRQMNRLFDDMLTPVTRENGIGLSFSPPAEFDETDEAYLLKLELPGMEPENINVEVTADSVLVSGERTSELHTEKQGSTRSEFRYGKFERSLPLPGRINHQAVVGDYKNGVRHLTLPKAKEEKDKVVKIKLT